MQLENNCIRLVDELISNLKGLYCSAENSVDNRLHELDLANELINRLDSARHDIKAEVSNAKEYLKSVRKLINNLEETRDAMLEESNHEET